MGEATWGPGGEEPTVRFQPPVDPWPDAHDGLTEPIPVRPARRRREVYGRVYELNLRNPAPEEKPSYVGMTEQTIHQRVHGPSGHTSPASVAKDPWKARILPGKAGYRELERVLDTGDPAENDRALRRAEAFWIDRLRPKYNDVRPVRPFVTETQPPRVKRPARSPRPAPRPVSAAERRRRGTRIRALVRLAAYLFLAGLFTHLTARVVLAMHLPWPTAPWVVAPVIGFGFAWVVFWRVYRSARRLAVGRR